MSRAGSVDHPQLNLALTHQALEHAGRQHPGTDRSSIPWMARMTDAQRVYLRGTGNRLMALLMQYSSRETGNELYLEEGARSRVNTATSVSRWVCLSKKPSRLS